MPDDGSNRPRPHLAVAPPSDLPVVDPALAGPAAGGIALTLRGEHLDALHPPVQLLFGTAEGAETQALDLVLHNGSFATATIPALVGATSHARADARSRRLERTIGRSFHGRARAQMGRMFEGTVPADRACGVRRSR